MNRRTTFLGILALSLAALVSCQRENDAPSTSVIKVKASLEAQTKTTYLAERQFSWLEGDVISIIADRQGSQVLLPLTSPSSGAAVTFSGPAQEGDKPLEKAFYPESLAALESGTPVLTLPASFTPSQDNPLSVIPLIGTHTKDNNYSFATASAIFKVTVTDIPADAYALRLTHAAKEVVLSGSFSLPKDGVITPACAVESNGGVTLNFTQAGEGTQSFYFPLPVAVIPSGLQLTLLRSAHDDYPLAITSRQLELVRNRIVDAGVLSAGGAQVWDVETITAVIQNNTGKTTFNFDDGCFSWAEGDEIDAVVCQDGQTFTSRRYVSLSAGVQSDFLIAVEQEEQKSGLELSDWAFYPSRESEKAQNGGFALQWDVRPNYYPEDKERYPSEEQIITIDLPSVVTLQSSNPMEVMPMLGVREGFRRYSFTPMTSILAVEVNSLTDDLDFISLSGSGALSGSFHLNQATGSISQDDAIAANPDGITINFSGVGSEHTFYFPVPTGVIPAGLVIKVGSSRSPEDAMERFTVKDLDLTQPGLSKTLHFSYQPKDMQWAEYAAATFLDDFIWTRHSAYTSGVPVDVVVERSGLHPERFRIANPYTVANEKFGYTPYTEGITADPYLIFTIPGDSEIIHFNPFILGVEDSDSGGKPMMITHPADWTSSRKGTYNRVVSATKEGAPLEIELAAVYSDPSNSGYMYSRDGEGSSDPSRIHIVLEDTTPEIWEPVVEGEFIDQLLWGNHGWGSTRVPVVLEQSSKSEKKFRVANPYLNAAVEFGYSTYTAGIEGAEYIEITIKDDDLVYYPTFYAGIEDKGSGGKPMKVWYPNEWGSAYDVSYNKVLEWRSDGLPARIQFAPVYSDVNPSNYGYKYTKNTTPTIFFWFTEEPQPEPVEEWTAAGELRYRDNFMFTDCPYATVPLETSNLGRYRIENPYPVLANLTGASLSYTPDTYLVFSVDDKGLVEFDTMVTGMEKEDGGYKWSVSISHPSVLDKNVNYNKVLSTDESGAPAIIQLAPVFHESGDLTSKYKYSRDTYDNIVRMLMPGVPDKSGLVVVSHVQYPMFAGEERQILSLEHPSGTIESYTVVCDHPELVESYALKDNKNIYATMKEGPYTSLPSIRFTLTECIIGGSSIEIEDAEPQPHFLGVKMRTGGYSGDTITGEDGVASYRIPALVTSRKGTLIAAYDARWKNSIDLQGDIDVGVSRSLDGGKTWGPMIIAMDMGEYGGLGQELNGIGDPCLLVDENTGEIFCFAVWAHGHANSRCLYWAGTGFEIEDTPQFMMVRSTDDGLTWSAPVNITRQVKRANWMMTFQGPGRGITMKDGTLVVPIQHQEGSRSLNSGIMYSTDHGNTWHAHNYARAVTSESCVAEIEPGVLLLSMRDETNSHFRAAYITTDLGRSWTPHEYDAKMIEPTCEASMLHVDAADNASGKDILLFSNPHSQSGRNHMTIQLSLDGGKTWPSSVLLDTGGWLGYSCLTMVDSQTVGIVHESFSQSIIFQSVPLSDLIAY